MCIRDSHTHQYLHVTSETFNNSVISVSYTHLDVYKRQVVSCVQSNCTDKPIAITELNFLCLFYKQSHMPHFTVC